MNTGAADPLDPELNKGREYTNHTLPLWKHGYWLTIADRVQIACLAVWTSITLFTKPEFSSLAHLVLLFGLWVAMALIAVVHFFAVPAVRIRATRIFLTIPVFALAVLYATSLIAPPILQGAAAFWALGIGMTAYPAWLLLRFLWSASERRDVTGAQQTGHWFASCVTVTAAANALLSSVLAAVFFGILPLPLTQVTFEPALSLASFTAVAATLAGIPYAIFRLIRGQRRGNATLVIGLIGIADLLLIAIYALIAIGVGSS